MKEKDKYYVDNIDTHIKIIDRKLNFIPFNKWYYRILNIFYYPLRKAIISLVWYISYISIPFIMLIYWIIKGEEIK